MVYVFGDYELDTDLYELRRAGMPVRLEPRVFDVLAHLVQHRDHVVPKQELFDHLWPELSVGDAALERCILAARQAVGDNGREQQVIKTIRGRGYRFIEAIEERHHSLPIPDVLTTSPSPNQPPPSVKQDEDKAGAASPSPKDEASLASPIDTRPCAECEHVNDVHATYCVHCGSLLVQHCHRCGEMVLLPAVFCPGCGQRLTQTSDLEAFPDLSLLPQDVALDPTPSIPHPLGAEHKQVTVLCCALTNVSAVAEHQGLNVLTQLWEDFSALAQHEVQRYEGVLQPFSNDGFVAFFGAPVAYEDHARRAVMAAFAIQQGLRERCLQSDVAPAAAIAIRMGIHTGLSVVGRTSDDMRQLSTIVGEASQIASHLQHFAESGTILLSASTYQLARHAMRLEVSDPVHFTWPSGPITVYKALRIGVAAPSMVGLHNRPLSQFVGRKRELETLHELLSQVADRQGQVLGIVGEPGMGKSRLLYEFRRSIAEKQLVHLEGRCPTYGSSIPYLPVLDILRMHCTVTDADDPAAITTKVRAGLSTAGMASEEAAPYLLQLLGLQAGTDRLAKLPPETVRLKTHELLCQMLLRLSMQQPLIISLEDCHWIDSISAAFFALLAESLAGSAILLIATYRPGYWPPWGNKSYVTQMALHRLIRQDSLAVVHSIRQPNDLPDLLAETILSKAEGNPLFLEELTRAVAEHPDLAGDIAVPNTVQGVLMARIDRLPMLSKRLLQTAAVLGREVSVQLLKAIWKDADDLGPHLRELQQQEFLYEQSGGNEPVYIFKHALTQDVTYGSLLLTQRQMLHAAAGQGLETLYADRLEEVVDRLAYHYARTTDTARAAAWLSRAADKAMRECAYTEAVATLQEALGHIERLPAAEQIHALPSCCLRLVDSLHYLGRFPESLEVMSRLQVWLEQHRQTPWAGPYYAELGFTYSMLGERDRAMESLERALSLGEDYQDKATMGKAHYMLALEKYWTGQPQQGVAHAQQATTLLEQHENQGILGMAHLYLSLNYMLLGDFHTALNVVSRAQKLGMTSGEPGLQNYLAWLTGWIHAMQGDWEQGIALCRQSLVGSPHPLNTALALVALGYTYVEAGDALAAFSPLQQALEHIQQFQHRPLQGWVTVLLGEAHRLHGQPDSAAAFLQEGLDIATQVSFGHGVGVAQRAQGRVAMITGNVLAAERYFTAAMATFTAMPARYELSRTHLDLALLAQTRGALDNAATHLSQAHALFRALRLPRYLRRTVQLAEEFGLSLPPA